jgi:hypothetical protein
MKVQVGRAPAPLAGPAFGTTAARTFSEADGFLHARQVT